MSENENQDYVPSLEDDESINQVISIPENYVILYNILCKTSMSPIETIGQLKGKYCNRFRKLKLNKHSILAQRVDDSKLRRLTDLQISLLFPVVGDQSDFYFELNNWKEDPTPRFTNKTRKLSQNNYLLSNILTKWRAVKRHRFKPF
ncbi:hypothetical protein ACFFRR_003199 [Megaselia abdita]